MARIKNIDLPANKQIKIGLTVIYGVGRPLALQICEAAKVDPSKKVKDFFIIFIIDILSNEHQK